MLASYTSSSDRPFLARNAGEMETCFPPKTLRIFDVHGELGSPSNPAAAAVITLSGQVLQKSVNAACIHNIGGVWVSQVAGGLRATTNA